MSNLGPYFKIIIQLVESCTAKRCQPAADHHHRNGRWASTTVLVALPGLETNSGGRENAYQPDSTSALCLCESRQRMSHQVHHVVHFGHMSHMVAAVHPCMAALLDALNAANLSTQHFDLRAAACDRHLQQARQIYSQAAAHPLRLRVAALQC